jgi:cyclophilin family peptidyl-prolyl cis-trans isomerase/protein-disulfide isomerase
MRMISMGGTKLLLIGIDLTLWMAGCNPAILHSNPVASTEETSSIPVLPTIQYPLPACQTVVEADASTSDLNYGYPPVSPQDWVEGPETAAVTFTFYGDFLCPYSTDLDAVLAQLVEEFPQDLRVVFRQLPIQDSYLPAFAIEAAGLQSPAAVNPLRHYLFAHQADWITLTGEQFLTWLRPEILELGLDEAQFEADILSEPVKQNILADLQNAETLQIPGTPFVLINQKPYPGLQDMESLRSIINRYQALSNVSEKTYTACPTMTIDTSKDLRARIITTQGIFLVDLYEDQVPFTVNNFVFLARQGWYKDNPFYRVIPGRMLQTGDPTGTGSGNAGYVFGNEIRPDLQFDQPGLLAMANSGTADPISNSSQFFITYDAIPSYSGGYTIFGKVIEGLDLIHQFPAADPMSGEYAPPQDRILSIEILEGE